MVGLNLFCKVHVQWRPGNRSMGLTESGPILESVRFVRPANFEWRDTSQPVYRYTLLGVDIKVDY